MTDHDDIIRRIEQYEEVVDARLGHLELRDEILQKELDVLLDEVIGPKVRGVTGTPVLDEDGLPMRDRSQSLGARSRIPTSVRVAVLLAASTIIAALVPEVINHWIDPLPFGP